MKEKDDQLLFYPLLYNYLPFFFFCNTNNYRKINNTNILYVVKKGLYIIIFYEFDIQILTFIVIFINII